MIIEQMIYGFLGWKLVSWETALGLKRLLPLESMTNLINEPFSRLNAVQSVAAQMGERFELDYGGVHWYEILVVLIWTIVFVYCSLALLRNRDL